jgi:hypothetical protein
MLPAVSPEDRPCIQGMMPDETAPSWAHGARPGDLLISFGCLRQDDERIVQDTVRRINREVKPP